MTAIRPVNTISFTGKYHSGREKVQDGATAVGAVGATGAGIATAKNLNNFNKFKQFGLGKAIDNTLSAVNKVTKPIKEAKIVKGKFGQNCKAFTDSIVRWGAKFKNNKIVGPLLNSKLFKGTARGIGSVTAVFVLISGLSNIVSVAGDALQGNTELA